jgi:hypothetical protein
LSNYAVNYGGALAVDDKSTYTQSPNTFLFKNYDGSSTEKVMRGE